MVDIIVEAELIDELQKREEVDDYISLKGLHPNEIPTGILLVCVVSSQ